MAVFTTHIDDILGCGQPDVLPKIRAYLGQRFGELQLRESSFVGEGTDSVQESDFPVTLA